MFIRENKNRSGSISIQVVEKNNGKNKVIFSVGSASTREEIEQLKYKAQELIDERSGISSLFANSEDDLIERFVSTLSNQSLRIVGPQLVLEKVYNTIYSETGRKYFKDLVLCRIIYPDSKLRTVEYLSRHFNKNISEQTIYRGMDNLDDGFTDTIEQLTFREAQRQSSTGTLTLVFYDMTTLYFEAESEDDLRKIGYSKDGKHQHPQIMIGLLVTSSGFPIAYQVFEGNTSETKTLIPVLENLIKSFSLNKPIIVADAALLSKSNLKELQKNGYTFILGGRIKNESNELKSKIIQLGVTEKQPREINHPYGRLVVSFSNKRKKKDQHNRAQGLKRLEKKVATGKLTKQAINNRGYNKYLRLEGAAKVTIDYDKYKEDEKWDGLKGFVTNTELKAEEVIANYTNLWQVEKAFRMSKTDLRFRPIYHRKESRIKSHLLICFAAFAVYKRFEVALIQNEINISVQKAIDVLKKIQEIKYQLPKSKILKTQILAPNTIQKQLLDIKI